jgi:hypothetical protein
MGLFGKLFGSKQPAPPCAIHNSDRVLVRDSDVAWWSGLSLDDCKAFEQQDNVTRVAALQKFMEEDGLSEEEAARKIRVTFPFYYWAIEQREDEHFPLSASDAKLPYVLKDRINRALMSRKIDRQSLSKATSFNALIRELIQSGAV